MYTTSYLRDRRLNEYAQHIRHESYTAYVKQLAGARDDNMANTQKQAYVADLLAQLQENPHLVVVGFTTTSHRKLEDLRSKLRASGEQAPSVIVLKNSLFKIAFAYHNNKAHLIADDQSELLQSNVKGQSVLLLMNDEWMTTLKTLKDFAKDEEGFEFRVGLIDGNVYEDAGLTQLANLPSKEQLIIKLIGALKAPQSRFVYGLKFSSLQLVTVLKNASAKTPAQVAN